MLSSDTRPNLDMISSVWLGMAIISMKDLTFKGFRKVLVLLVTSV